MESPGQAGLVSSGGCQWWESWARVPKSSVELQSHPWPSRVGSASPKELGGQRSHPLS